MSDSKVKVTMWELCGGKLDGLRGDSPNSGPTFMVQLWSEPEWPYEMTNRLTHDGKAVIYVPA